MNILITGGAGFIGSHVVRLFVEKYSQYNIYNLDKLTYSGNLENVKDLENRPNYHFLKGDIADLDFIREIFAVYNFDKVIHLAAESHVDRSISDPLIFIKTNILGTATLLQVAKESWNGNYKDKLFYHVSTDEVYGSLSLGGDFFYETTAYNPRSPYSASKASSDHIVRAWGHTYKMPIVLSNCSNNYGSFQFPEKLIPLFINNIVHQKPLPVYGKGINVRDWLWVEDHARAIDVIFHHMGTSEKLITYVKDRAGHDLRYAIDASKLEKELGWKPSLQFEEGLSKTIDWYLSNQEWMDNITSGAYQEFYEQQYNNR